MLNSTGDNGQPCRTPVIVLNHELNVPSHNITALLASWYTDLMQFISDLLMLYLLSTAQSPWCHTLSEALVKSMKLRCNSLLCTMYFSLRIRRLRICSMVLLH